MRRFIVTDNQRFIRFFKGDKPLEIFQPKLATVVDNPFSPVHFRMELKIEAFNSYRATDASHLVAILFSISLCVLVALSTSHL